MLLLCGVLLFERSGLPGVIIQVRMVLSYL